MLPPHKYLTKEQNNDPISVLPLIPDPFRFEPNPELTKEGKVMMKNDQPVISKRFLTLEKLCKQADTIVNACDIDREGQLIFDELISYIGRDPYDQKILRASIVSMTPEALEQAASKLDKNGDAKWVQRGDAAATRQKMDWLLGMNASMAYQVVTGIRTISVGRVQTPVLAMVVRRDLEIENFTPQTYYTPIVEMSDGTRLRWDKREGSQDQSGFDPNGKIILESLARSIVDQISRGLPGEVKVSQQEDKSESPPLPFSMGALQSEVSKQLGLNVAQVTKATQNLYEKHKCITYVGTDCRYMPEEMHQLAPQTIQKLSSEFPEFVKGADVKIKSRAFNDAKVDEHFAIVPTGVIPVFSPSEQAEKGIYEAIVKRYLAQFYPQCRTQVATLVIAFGPDEFRTIATKVIDLGWKRIDPQKSSNSKKEDP